MPPLRRASIASATRPHPSDGAPRIRFHYRIRGFFDQVGLQRLVPLLDVDLVTTRRYGVLLPSTFFIDSSGTIRDVRIGEMDQANLQRGLDRIK